MSTRTLPRESPYVGLTPYSEDDAAFFFGRGRETELIIANLFASRLTLLYGPSGVGKSSVLRAGVVRRLREGKPRDDTDVPGLAIVVFNAWRDDPIVALDEAISQAVGEPATVREGSPALSLVDTLRSWTERIHGQLLIILDQFEEYFLYHGRVDGGGTFAREFPRAVNREDLDVNFLISIREDAVAKLDRFKGRIPDLFANYLRVEHLRRAAARTAVEEPIAQYNLLIGNGAPYRIEPELVDAVLDQVRTGQLVVGQTGAGVVSSPDDDPARTQIETSHLQIVMKRLWKAETGAGSHVLRLETLERLGGSQRIVQEHLDEAMNTLPAPDQDLAVRVFKQLVTPSGTKIAHTAKDLAEYADAEPATLAPVLEQLASADLRILRPVAPPPDQPDGVRFEIFHDVLAPAILDWRARRVREQERADERERHRHAAEERARRKVRRTQVLSATMALLLVVSILGWSGERARSGSESRQRAATAMAQLGSDPSASIRTALAGISEAATPEAENALRVALAESHVRVVMLGHEDGIQDLDITPDGSAIVTASRDNTARVWDVGTGQPLAELTGHEDRVNTAAFSPDGSRVVTASEDATARVWDARTGRRLAVLDDHGDAVRTASFSPDGTAVVTASSDGIARLWNAHTGDQVASLGAVDASRPQTDPVLDARFSPDGTHVVTADQAGRVRVWDTRTGQQRAQLDKHRESPVTKAVFSPDGQRVVTAGKDSHAYVWRWQTRDEPTDLFAPTFRKAFDVDLSPDGLFVIIAWGKAATVYEAGTGQFVTELRGHADSVKAARFSPDGTLIVTVGGDGRARLWEASNGGLLAEMIGHRGDIRDAVFTPDGRRVVTASLDGTARVWEPALGRALFKDRRVRGAAFSQDGAFVVGAGQDGIARVWRAEDGREEAVLSAENASTRLADAVFGPNGRYVATAGDDGLVRVWDWRAHQIVATSHQPAELASVAFSPDGELVVTAGPDEVARVWDWRAHPTRPLRLLRGHTGAVQSAAFSPDGSLVVTASEDRTARVWNAATGALVRSLVGHDGAVTDAAFSPDGARIVTASNDRTARVWDWTARDEPRAVLTGHDGSLTGAAFDADGHRVVTGASDGVVGVWDATGPGRNLAFLRRHSDSVNSAVFSPDGRLILTASDDQTVRLFACETCGSLQDLQDLAEQRLGFVPEQVLTGAAARPPLTGSVREGATP
ncbi:MAG: hypothetical protein ACRDZO_06080 [Egibacteraceae bacterium]